MTNRSVVRLMSIAILSLTAISALAGQLFDENKNGVALNRYDPVSYFTAPEPIRGIGKYEYVYKDTKFRFISARNRRTFMENPEHYAPRFGGYCAYGATRGEKITASSRVFDIVDGKLYLFSDRGARREWKKDVSGNIARADERWSGNSTVARKD